MNAVVNYQYLRPLKAQNLKECHERIKEKEKLSVEVIENGTILPLKRFEEDKFLHGRGGVVDALKQYVPISGIPGKIYDCYSFSEAQYEDKTIVYCGYLMNHWGHFLIESVARLWYYLQQDGVVDNYVFFVREGDDIVLKGNYKEFLELLGIASKVEIINKPTRYRKIIIPELSYMVNDYYSKCFLSIFDKVRENAVEKYKRNIQKEYPKKYT